MIDVINYEYSLSTAQLHLMSLVINQSETAMLLQAGTH